MSVPFGAGGVATGTAPSDALVLFGGTGDVARKKIYPALLAMARRGRLHIPVIAARAPGSKLPGAALVGRDLELYCCNEQDDAMDAYERLIGDALRGDAALFARQDTVEAVWSVVEAVLGDAVPIVGYEAETWGPEGADALIAPFGRWRAPVADA